MRRIIFSLGAVLILLVAIGMQYVTLTFGLVVEGFIRDAFGWFSLALAFIAGGAITAMAAGENP